MKKLTLQFIFLTWASIGVATDTTTPEQKQYYEELKRKIEWAKNIPVPEPEKTPYDNDPEARKAYIGSYQSAYRKASVGIETTCCIMEMPHREAVIKGHYDGILAVLKKVPLNTPLRAKPPELR